MWRIISGLGALSKRFATDKRGNISMLFAFSSVAIVIAAGAGIDLGRAYFAKQRLIEAATLACQYASRPSIVDTSTSSYSGSNGGATYMAAVNSYITATLQSQHFQYSQTTTLPFSYTQNGTADVKLTANVPTAFMQIINVKNVPVSATSHCYDTPSTPPQTVANGSSAFVISEGFENSSCGSTSAISNCVSYILPDGTIGRKSSPTNTFTSTSGYTGLSGVQWYIMGYCLEVDTVGVIESAVPEGTHSAELDCDNGSSTAGNSSISTKTYLAAGNYELRYNFASRVDYPDYDPVYICGSATSDLSWASNTNSSGWNVSNALRTNQINTYLDLNTNGAPPTHATMVGSQTLGGYNLIDMCVYSNGWIERSVRIKVTTAGYYWLSFAADGANDSYGGQIDNIRLCQETCATSLQDNFPSKWLAANNGGVNKVLFEDTFEAPIMSASCTGCNFNTTATLDTSYGTSGSSSSGWPSLAASGWAISPYDQIDYYLSGSAQGNQSIEPDADLNSGQTTSNRTLSRAFLLDPGYYQINYDYISDLLFAGQTQTFCAAAPSAATLLFYNSYATQYGSGTNRMSGLTYSGYYDSNYIGVFVSNGQLVSTPVGGAGLNATTSFTNPPNGTTSTTATAPLDYVNLASYNATQNNQLVDFCGFSTSWQTRTAYIQIVKPGYYWLSIAALGHADNQGGAIDDVKLTALGSLYMSSPPANAVTIPVPSPQNGASTSFTGFTIISDPLTPPAALQ